MTATIWAIETVANEGLPNTDEGKPSITTLKDGSYVVVWQNSVSLDIEGRHYAADGTALGDAFLVNSVTAGSQLNPSVVGLANGGFTVTWMEGNTIENRQFAADATPLGVETAHSAGGPVSGLASSALGTGFGRVDVYVVNQELYQTRYNANGTVAGTSMVNKHFGELGDDGLAQINPDVVELTNGYGYVITWTASNSNNVYARIYASTGVAKGEEFILNTAPSNGFDSPKVTALANGGFVVTWDTQGSAGDSSQYDIRARVYDNDGAAITPDFRVNALTNDHQYTSEVVGLEDGGFLVLWMDGLTDGIVGQHFDAFGARIGTTFDVSSLGGGAAGVDGLSATLLADGRVAVSWEADDGVGYYEDVHVAIIDPREGLIRGGTVADTLYGGAGADQVVAYAGDDLVFAGGGEDAVLAGAGNDTLHGGRHDDDLQGQTGDDVLSGGRGGDRLDGGAGTDTASYADAARAVKLNLATGEHTGEAQDDVFVSIETFALSAFNDTLTGGDDAEHILGLAGNDSVQGGAGDDWIEGGSGSDKLSGGADIDFLRGEEGADKLYGELGDDHLEGGMGADELFGGAGADRFIFDAVEQSTVAVSGRDVIKDFSLADGDVIDLLAIDAIAGGGDDAFTLVASFTGAAGELMVKAVNGGDKLVQGDLDGDKTADFAILVENVGMLEAGDFVL